MSVLLIAALIQAFVIVLSQDSRVRQWSHFYVVPVGIAIAGALAAGALLSV